VNFPNSKPVRYFSFCPRRSARVCEFAGIVLACLFVTTGCITVPTPALKPGISQQELKADVAFLAQPGLKGRKPKTHGSKLARDYIEERFKACGLIPWNNEKGFGLSFGYGENIVGVLPGSDTNLAREFVIVSAHYDHLGKKGGSLYPGAADNASGVAALLETAKELSLFEDRPKRSVAFVAFDSEELMLFGSFAFTCRTDVASSPIAAVVNVDMLGRDFMDVSPHTLFIAGAEHYPRICDSICGFGAEARIRVLPVGTDLVGPRGDHAAFENRPIPCLFFSCGPFKDYHQPTDIPEKLNYSDIESSARVILSTVKVVANRGELNRMNDTTEVYARELKSVVTVMNEVVQKSDRVNKQDVADFEKLARHALELLNAGNYDARQRANLIADATGIMAPYLMPLDELKGMNKSEQQYMAVGMQFFERFYLQHRMEMLEAYRKFVAHVLNYRPGPLRGMPKFKYEICSFSDDNISFTSRSDELEELHVMLIPVTLEGEVKRSKWLLESFSFSIGSVLIGLDCEGTREQLLDLCLLRFRNDHSSALHSNAFSRVLQVVAGAQPGQGYNELLKARLENGGFKNEAEWLEACIRSPKPELALEALSSQSEDRDQSLHKAACEVVADGRVRGDVRALAIDFVMKKKDKQALLALCEAVDDPAPTWKKEYMAALAKDYPFSERSEFKSIRPLIETVVEHQPNASKTISDLANAQLKKATKQDFGKDSGRWRSWIQSNTKVASL
jgi:hypothetical protein